jgi:hypothetical protein
MALAGPPKEKPHLAPYLNAGTAEPMGVSPPEAAAYLVLVKLERQRNLKFIDVVCDFLHARLHDTSQTYCQPA